MMFVSIKEKLSSLYIPKPDELLQLPIGVRDGGELVTAMLSRSKSQHVLVMGATGSGKSMFVNFVLASLQHMYGSDVRIHYISGKPFELKQWKKPRSCKLLSTGVFCNVVDAGDLCETLRELIVRVSRSRKRSLIVLDDIQHHIEYRGDVQELIKLLIELAPQHNAHILYTMQGRLDAGYMLMKDFVAVGATHVQDYVSTEVFGNTMGYDETRQWGDVAFKLGDTREVLRVPETHIPFDLAKYGESYD